MSARAVGWGYTACVFALVASVAWQEFPPCVDYPQHLALAKQLRDLFLGQGEGHWVFWTYNGLFHFSTAVLALALPLELAGRLVLASSLAMSALSVWKVLRFGERPGAFAFLWLPFAYSQAFAWGFVNFTLSVALATFATLVWLERRSRAAFILLSWLAVFAHPLGIAIVTAGALVGVVGKKHHVRSLVLLIPAIVWVALAHAGNDSSPHIGWANEIVWPAASERLKVFQNLLGPWNGDTDDRLALGAAAVLILGLGLSAARSFRQPRNLLKAPFAPLAGSALLVYAVGPLSLYGCWYFYQRAGYCVLLWLPALLPKRVGKRWEVAMMGASVILGAASTLNFVSHQLRTEEAADARAIINAIPFGASVAPVLDVEKGSSAWQALRGGSITDKVYWGHFPAYLVVRRNAELTWMFSREHGHFPVRHPSRGELGFPIGEHAWMRTFLPDAEYAGKYRHILVRTTDSNPDESPVRRVFGDRFDQAMPLAHHGRFWLFEFVPEAS